MKTPRRLPLRRSASSQRNPVYSSLEAYVAGAESVYLASLAELDEHGRDEAGAPCVRVILDVTQTLKGERRKRAEAITYLDNEQLLEAWRTWSHQRTPLLGFLHRPRKDQREAAAPEIVDPLLPVDPADFDRVSPHPVVGYFSMDFRLLRTPRPILDVVRRYIKTAPKTVPIHSLRYLPDLIRKQFPYNTGGELLVPVVPELEAIARRMILSPASFLPAESKVLGVSHPEYLAFKATDEGSLRRMGVEALGRFKSGANIALLKRCLDDPFLEPYWDIDQDVYSVRKMALEALRKWGVKVAPPQLHRAPEGIK